MIPSLTPRTLCLLDKEYNVISQGQPNKTHHCLAIEIHKGALEQGIYEITIELELGSPKKARVSVKEAEYYIVAETLGANLKAVSAPVRHKVAEPQNHAVCSLTFDHKTPLPVDISFNLQKIIKDAHLVRIKSAKIEQKKVYPQRKVLVQTEIASAHFSEPLSLPSSLKTTIGLLEATLPKGEYLLYLLGCGTAEISVNAGAKVLANHLLKCEMHQEYKISFSIKSKTDVQVQIKDMVGPVFIERLQVKALGTAVKENPLVACVIPSYNSKDTLKRSVLSLLNQTYPPHTIFIVDDHSTDNSLSVARGLKQTLSDINTHIEVLSNSDNLGPYVSKSLVISEYLEVYDFWCLQDADDYVLSEKLETQLKHFKKSPKALASYTFGNRVTAQGTIVKNRGLDARRIYAGALFKGLLFKKIGFFEPVRFGADDEFFNRQLNLLGKASAIVCTEALYKAEVRADSLTNSTAKMALDTAKEKISPVRKAYADLFADRKAYQSLWAPQKDTPKEMCVLPPIYVRMATYPKRFEPALKTALTLYESCSVLGAQLHICFNESFDKGAPKTFQQAFKNKSDVFFHTPKNDLKDNGKFLGVAEGINFWVDDDLIYGLDYFLAHLKRLLRTPKNTAFCLHGYDGTETTGFENRNLVHFARAPLTDYPCSVAGTGTASMWVEGAEMLNSLQKIAESKHTGMVDLIFGYALALRKTKAINIARPAQILFELEEVIGEESLFETNKERQDHLNKILTLINLTYGLDVL